MTVPTKRVLVTGAAGFIGSHLVDALLDEGGWQVDGLDNFDPFYAARYKEGNIRAALQRPHYRLIRADIRPLEPLETLLSGDYDVIVHLAARAGVRPSIADPLGYQAVNVEGTQNLLELAKRWGVKRFVFASSSSVYGTNPQVPWREEQEGLRPISPYASTKMSGELLGHVYSHLYGLEFVGLRFFTVYGPRQRPDLAIHKFARMMLAGQPLPVYGDGHTYRDYTFIADIISGVRAAMTYEMASLKPPFEIFNLGNDETVSLREMIAALEDVLGVKAQLEHLPEQPGDVPRTWADLTRARERLGYTPQTSFRSGLAQFASWLRDTPLTPPEVHPSNPASS